MSNIQNSQVLLHFGFNKPIKEPRTRLQSPVLKPKHVKNVYHATHQHLTKFHFDSNQDSKEISICVTLCSNYVAIPIGTSQILKSQKHKNVDMSRTKHYFFSLNKKIYQFHIKGLRINQEEIMWCQNQTTITIWIYQYLK